MTAEDLDYLAKEDTAWPFPVFLTELLLILIINAVTITAFARIRHLRKRSTYLIINLTVADLLVGAVTGPLFVYHEKEEDFGFTWKSFISLAFEVTFAVASQVNLCLISLDRLHSTLFPFRHCLIRKCVYFKIMIASWVISFLLACLMAGLILNGSHGGSYVWALFGILTLLVLTVSYVIIILNVQRNPHAQNHSSIHTERKLSVTLFIVTGVSVLTILPWATYSSMPVDMQIKLSETSSVDIGIVLAVIYFASSIVNPLVYAIRMREFRKAIQNLVCKTSEPSRVHPLQR
ncbi:histamine H2 receptor-like [Oculina patagonica]